MVPEYAIAAHYALMCRMTQIVPSAACWARTGLRLVGPLRHALPVSQVGGYAGGDAPLAGQETSP